jgi:hypothetical protein
MLLCLQRASSLAGDHGRSHPLPGERVDPAVRDFANAIRNGYVAETAVGFGA